MRHTYLNHVESANYSKKEEKKSLKWKNIMNLVKQTLNFPKTEANSQTIFFSSFISSFKSFWMLQLNRQVFLLELICDRGGDKKNTRQVGILTFTQHKKIYAWK